jgi:putative Mg2+ transporter-C (MgtC) family protein
MTLTDFSLRLLAGLGAGFLIGVEREWQNKPAGLRTNTLVATGSALFVLLAIRLTENYSSVADITRIIGQIVTGIGFLGAGIIFKEGNNIHGLTTAATVWCSAGIGCFAGAGFFIETLIGVAAIITVNLLLIPVDRWLTNRSKESDGKNEQQE